MQRKTQPCVVVVFITIKYLNIHRRRRRSKAGETIIHKNAALKRNGKNAQQRISLITYSGARRVKVRAQRARRRRLLFSVVVAPIEILNTFAPRRLLLLPLQTLKPTTTGANTMDERVFVHVLRTPGGATSSAVQHSSRSSSSSSSGTNVLKCLANAVATCLCNTRTRCSFSLYDWWSVPGWLVAAAR